MEQSQWRRSIVAQLRKRNHEERRCFEELIRAHNKHLDSSSSLKSKNVELEVEVARLRTENLNLKAGIGSGSGGSLQSNERGAALEQKVFALQEELTQLHRQRGSNAQKVVELKEVLQERDTELARKEASLSEALQAKVKSEGHIEQLKQALRDMENVNQVLKDDLQALNLVQTTTEEEVKRLEAENRDLIQRWMKLKGRRADKMNDSNDVDRQIRKQRVESELSEAMEGSRGGSLTASMAASMTASTSSKPAASLTPDQRKGKGMFESIFGSIRGVRGPNPVGGPLDVEVTEDPSLAVGSTVLKCVSACLPSKAIHKLDSHEGEVSAVRFSSNAGHMATSSDRKVKLWRLLSHQYPPEVIGTLQGCNAAVTSLDFDPQEQLLLAGSNDFSCRVWGIADQRLRHALTGHSNKVTSAKFLGDAGKVVSGSNDRTLKVWDLRNKACIRTIFAGSSCNDLITGDQSGTSVISGHFDKRIRFWDIRTDSSANEISLQGRITSLDFSPDRSSLLCSSRDEVLKVIDLRMHGVTHSFAVDGFKLPSDTARACFSPDGQYVACGSSDGSIYVWNVNSGQLEKTSPKEHNGAVLTCTWHPSGEFMLSGERSKRAIIWRE